MTGTANNGTYCPRLWDEAFIDEQGRVYACCHCLPELLGSIYDETLREISNNDTIQRLRRDSLAGRLACYRNCTLLDKSAPVEWKDHLQIEYGELKRLKLMFGEACNIECIMCWQDSKTGCPSISRSCRRTSTSIRSPVSRSRGGSRSSSPRQKPSSTRKACSVEHFFGDRRYRVGNDLRLRIMGLV